MAEQFTELGIVFFLFKSKIFITNYNRKLKKWKQNTGGDLQKNAPIKIKKPAFFLRRCSLKQPVFKLLR